MDKNECTIGIWFVSYRRQIWNFISTLQKMDMLTYVEHTTDICQGNKEDVSNYRPISLLNLVSKIAELSLF